MEEIQVGGALAGGLIATALMDALVAKGILTATDAKNVLLKARRTIVGSDLNAEQHGAASVLDFFLNRYPNKQKARHWGSVIADDAQSDVNARRRRRTVATAAASSLHGSQ